MDEDNVNRIGASGQSGDKLVKYYVGVESNFDLMNILYKMEIKPALLSGAVCLARKKQGEDRVQAAKMCTLRWVCCNQAGYD